MSAKRKILISFFTFFIVFFCVFLLWISNHYVVPIMMYHHVRSVDVPQSDVTGPERLREHFEYLKSNNYRVLSLDQFVKFTNEGRKFSRKTVVITFDDGYDNLYSNAYPIIKKYRFPVTMFIASDLIDQEGYLTWEQVKEMSENGISFGSHTRWHVYLPDLDKDVQEDEIVVSKHLIEGTLGVSINYFSYPIGGFNDQIKKFVQLAGYKGACATNRGYDKSNKDVFELNRTRFSDKDNYSTVLWLKLSGYYNLLREFKNSL